MSSKRGMYVLMVSPHGLLRGRDLELGRDADTGGQTLYVVELARALAAHPAVERVDLLTRRVEDPKVSDDYRRPFEELGPGARIVRVPCGPRRYLRKEVLWPHLGAFADRALAHVRRQRRVPDLIHTHYADAGWIGTELASPLGVPLVHTGHSLGRVKRQRLLAEGHKAETIEKRYHLARRIEAEEQTLDHAALVIASTRQEVDEQYSLYHNHHPDRMVVIPPGVDLERFRPPAEGEPEPAVAAAVDRFLREPSKPCVLAIARPDPRKNLVGLVRAFGSTPGLRERANLVLVAGTRDDVAELDGGARRVWNELLLEIDRQDLYGHVAYPKRHTSDELPELYRLAAARGGVFVNPALTEPFGLTLLEAAASGLPVVATDDGGPRDILAVCKNGVLVDALDLEAVGGALADALSDRRRRRRWAARGLENVHRHYRWSAHVERYLETLEERELAPRGASSPRRSGRAKAPLALVERLLVTDIDHTLLGDEASLAALVALVEERPDLGFGVATGRRLESAREVLEEHGVPQPDLFITGVGARIHYGHERVEDTAWARHLDYRWRREEVRELLLREFGDRLELQPESEQLTHKLSFYAATDRRPDLAAMRRRLREEGLPASLIFSHGEFLDVLPIRCSKGKALRWVVTRWGVDIERVLVAGDSGNDEEMLRGRMPAVVVANHAPELERLRGVEQVHFAERACAGGILEGIEVFGLLEERPRSVDPHESAADIAADAEALASD